MVVPQTEQWLHSLFYKVPGYIMVKIDQINSEIWCDERTQKIKCNMSDVGIAPIRWLRWTD